MRRAARPSQAALGCADVGRVRASSRSADSLQSMGKPCSHRGHTIVPVSWLTGSRAPQLGHTAYHAPQLSGIITALAARATMLQRVGRANVSSR